VCVIACVYACVHACVLHVCVLHVLCPHLNARTRVPKLRPSDMASHFGTHEGRRYSYTCFDARHISHVYAMQPWQQHSMPSVYTPYMQQHCNIYTLCIHAADTAFIYTLLFTHQRVSVTPSTCLHQNIVWQNLASLTFSSTAGGTSLMHSLTLAWMAATRLLQSAGSFCLEVSHSSNTLASTSAAECAYSAHVNHMCICVCTDVIPYFTDEINGPMRVRVIVRVSVCV